MLNIERQIPEVLQRIGYLVQIRKGRIRKVIWGDFRQAGKEKGLYAVNQQTPKAGWILQGF